MHQEFKRTFRGYDPHEVSAFLEVVAENSTELTRQNSELQRKLKTAEEELEQLKSRFGENEKAMQAYKQEMAKVERLMDSRMEADFLVQKARVESEKLVADAIKQADKIRSEIALLKDQRAKVAAHLREYLRSQMTLLGIIDDGQTAGPNESETLDGHETPAAIEIQTVEIAQEKSPSAEENKVELVDPESIDTFLSDVELDDIPQELAHALNRFKEQEEIAAETGDDEKKQQLLSDLDALAQHATGMFKKADFHKMLGNDIHKRSEEMINQIYAELEKKKTLNKDNSNPKEPS